MGLTAIQMSRLSALLDEALPLDEAGRRLWLKHLPPEHADLLDSLKAALLPSARLREFLTLPGIGSTPGPAASSGLQPGALVGPYELLRLLGAGGMAEVWLARRADGALKRELALKLPLRTQLRADLEPRFARERDILASLEHPRIARLYDAGVDPQGLPYLAMEYVPGRPLTDWCDALHLGIPARLELFRQVLEAVQYAHQKHVMHGDLKPSNILVTGSGEVRLLDFGVAKLLTAKETDQPPLTGVYGRATTPDYASPELLRGDPLDERSDLYSLGVLLYELLTGTRPYHLRGAASVGAIEHAITHVEVEPPSAQRGGTAKTDSWARQLRGDLDAIVMRALAKQPVHRYQSAADFSADLQRYREHKPIASQPGGAAYRLRKFVRRNAPLVGIAATALILVSASFAYTAYREYHERIVVRAPASASDAAVAIGGEKSVAVLPFLDLSENRDQGYFSDGLSEELIDLLARVPDLRVPARTSSFYFKDKSEQIATIAAKLHVQYVLEGSVRKSGQTLRVTAQLIRADTGFHLWSDTYDRELKDVFKVQDEIAGAVVGALKARLALLSPASHRTQNTEAYSQFLLGKQLLMRETFHYAVQAEAAFRKAVELDPQYADAYAYLAFLQLGVADQSASAEDRRKALDIANKAVSVGSNSAVALAVRGYARQFNWDWDGARSDLERALEIEPGNNEARRFYGELLSGLGRLPQAIAEMRKAVALDPLSSPAWMGLGELLCYDGDFASGEQALHRATDIEPQADTIHSLGECLLLDGRPAEALALYQKSPHPENEVFRHAGLAMAEFSLGHEQASQAALQSLMDREGYFGAYQVAGVYAWRGQKDKAFQWLDRAYEQHDGGLLGLKTDPLLVSLRHDARFADLIEELNLPEEEDTTD